MINYRIKKSRKRYKKKNYKKKSKNRKLKGGVFPNLRQTIKID